MDIERRLEGRSCLGFADVTVCAAVEQRIRQNANRHNGIRQLTGWN
jgi:hypothetical protein